MGDFELGEDIRTEGRVQQDERWAEAIVDGRGHVSHRELTMLCAPQFCLAIEDYQLIDFLVLFHFSKNSYLSKIHQDNLSQIVEYAFSGQGPLVSSSVTRHFLAPSKQSVTETERMILFRICVRKRPLLSFENDYGAYDVCQTSFSNNRIITLHQGKLARNGRQLSMQHRQFILDRVFDECASNLEVCEEAIAPLVSWAEAGNNSTLICFGQTGTGKTYTLNGALEFLSKVLALKTICVTFFEVHGRKCYDLLSGRNVVHLRADENQEIHVRGARQVTLREGFEPTEFMKMLEDALKLRSSQITERNPISSRSHAICSIEILGNALGSVKLGDSTNLFPKKNGKITLVDLAGSERNYETVKMSAQQHKESADINFALMALKDCFRAYYMHMQQGEQKSSFPSPANANIVLAESKNDTFSKQRIPYRSSILTKVLKNCFVQSASTHHRTTIIATISPTPFDLQHSLNTLDHVVLMSPKLHKLVHTVTAEIPMSAGMALSSTPVVSWTPAQVNAWLATAERGRFAQLALPTNLDGKGLMQLSMTNITNLVCQIEQRQAREEQEGSAWMIDAENNRARTIGKALWGAIRRQNASAIAKKKSAR